MKTPPIPPRHRRQRRAILEIYVSAHCWQCPEARNIAEEMGEEFVPLDVRVIDLDTPSTRKPAVVFAVPTFLLNGRIVSIGTPSRDVLRLKIQDALSAGGMRDEPG